MRRLVKAFFYISILLFLIVLLWVYAYLPKEVGVLANEMGEATYLISKESFFYLMIGILLFSNLVLYAFRKIILLNYLRPKGGKPPKPSWISLRKDVADWMLAFAGSLNIFYILGLVYISAYNNPDDVNLASFGPVVYAGPFLIGLLLLILIYLFIKKRS